MFEAIRVMDGLTFFVKKKKNFLLQLLHTFTKVCLDVWKFVYSNQICRTATVNKIMQHFHYWTLLPFLKCMIKHNFLLTKIEVRFCLRSFSHWKQYFLALVFSHKFHKVWSLSTILSCFLCSFLLFFLVKSGAFVETSH